MLLSGVEEFHHWAQPFPWARGCGILTSLSLGDYEENAMTPRCVCVLIHIICILIATSNQSLPYGTFPISCPCSFAFAISWFAFPRESHKCKCSGLLQPTTTSARCEVRGILSLSIPERVESANTSDAEYECDVVCARLVWMCGGAVLRIRFWNL